MKPFTERVVAIIKNIPEGKVMTYGQVAALAGSPRGARQVVRVLHSLSAKHQLPWHRVILSSGEISRKNEELCRQQKLLLECENVVVSGENVDLSRYQFGQID